MRFRQFRIVEPEILDDQPPEQAALSLRDIVRINRLTGGHAVLCSTLRRLVGPDEHFSVLDIGAASGDAGVVIRRAFHRARVFSLDYRHHHLRTAPPDRIVADAFQLPFAPRSVDIVYCGMFLHHFENAAIVELLRCFGQIARRFIIVNDLERSILPYYFLPATRRVFGWHPITLHDGPVSVQASFKRSEILELARRAGLDNIDARVHRPAFRVSMVASPPRC